MMCCMFHCKMGEKMCCILSLREDDPDDSRTLMTMARVNARYFAVVHITAAQIEIEDGQAINYFGK